MLQTVKMEWTFNTVEPFYSHMSENILFQAHM